MDPERPLGRGWEIGMALRTLLRAGRQMQTAMGRRMSLGDTDLEAMDELAASREPLGPVELGHRLGIRSASATVLVDRLEAAGHLRRAPHPTDRRRIVLSPTSSARDEVRAILAPMMASINSIAAGLDDRQTETVIAFLQAATIAIEEFAAAPAGSDEQP